jgi:hypothetical protein
MIVSKNPQTTAAARIDSLQEKLNARPIRRIKTNEMHGERADITANSTYFPSGALYRWRAGFVPILLPYVFASSNPTQEQSVVKPDAAWIQRLTLEDFPEDKSTKNPWKITVPKAFELNSHLRHE